MSSESDAIIEIPVKLISDVSGDPVAEQQQKSGFFDLDEDTLKQLKQEMKDDIEKEIENTFDEKDIDIDKLAAVTRGLGDVPQQGMSTIRNVASNPQGFIGNKLLSIIGSAGPHGAIALAIITTILAAPEFVKFVVKLLGQKGGPLNQDYKFSLQDQFNQEFTRATQFRRVTGDDPLITFNTIGFAVGDPDFVHNSLIDTNKARTGRIGLAFSSLRGP